MSSQDEDFIEIKPVAIDRPGGDQGAGGSPGRGGGRSGRGILVAVSLLVLLALAGAVVFLLPAMIETDTATPPVAQRNDGGSDAANAAGEGGAGSPAAGDSRSPEEQAAGAGADVEARQAAQDALLAARELERKLLDKAVERWAPEDFDKARARIEAGQEAYKQLDYAAAVAAYREGLSRLEALEATVPEVLEGFLEAGRQALADGRSEAAAEAFGKALAIAPDNEAAKRGKGRTETLDEVLKLIARAGQREADGDFAAAQDAYQQALDLDPHAKAAEAGVERMRRALVTQRYRAAMSAGFAALETGDLEKARSAFERALKIRPEDQGASSALEQVEAAETDERLSRLLAEAERLEAREDWFAAMVRYDKALKLDGSLVQARKGLARAKRRAELAVRIEKFLEAPERLRTAEVREEAKRVREEARTVGAAGPKLRAQIAKLSRLIELASTPVPVILTSDGKTEVTVYRVGELGRFERQQLELLPGDYVAVGTRDGYRDERVEFTVDPEQPGREISVRARQRIAFGSR